jgi:pimeloyl-ACP methyl ester carboxylesterase
MISPLLLIASVAGAQTVEHFDSDGVTIRFVQAGQGEPVVLSHGFGGSADGAWVQPGTFAAIADAGFRVIAIDHRGHGGSEKPHDPDAYGRNMAEDVRRLLDHLQVDRAHIVGYSMGAKVANTFCNRYPGRTLSLTLGGYGWPWRSPNRSLEEARIALTERDVLPGNDLEALAAYQVHANDLVPAEQDLRSNRIPTLSLVGIADEAVPRADVETLRSTMSNVTGIDMPGTHAGPDGALYKERFAREIVQFLRQNSQR